MKESGYKIITHTKRQDGYFYRGAYDYNGFQEKVEEFLKMHKNWEPVGGITATKDNIGHGMEYTLAQCFICKPT